MDAAVACSICCRKYKNKTLLSRHVIKVHKVKKGSIKCNFSDCEGNFRTIADYRNHLREQHSTPILCEKIVFQKVDEFEQWLIAEERKTNAHFVLLKGEAKRVGYSLRTYICNRSGIYKTQGQGRRQLKSQGSCKVGFYCTAGITVKITECVQVEYHKTHFGHAHDISHIPLPKEIKETVAGKLVQGVTEKRILEDIRLSFREDMKREHLMKMKDIANIKHEFGIQQNYKGSVLKSDETSVSAMVEEMRMKDPSPVLFFKNQGEQHPVLKKDDFFLVIMTGFQETMFKKFGSDRICIDSTHGMGGYGFELATVLVIDEYEEGLPVAFCITSSVNTESMMVFFECIKNKISDLSCEVFMSDDTPIFSNAWDKIFRPCKKRLLCSWHVIKAWKLNLNKIKGDKKAEVFKTLKTLLYELDETAFNKMLSNLLLQFEEDDDTNEFGIYFRVNYCNRVNMWAYCFRKGAKINTNNHIESFHKTLKHIYLQGKKTKRVDKCIKELLNIVTDKSFDNLIKSFKGKINKKCTDNYNRHKESLSSNFNVKDIYENVWELESNGNSYTVVKKHDCDDKCLISCRYCHCCLYAYECSCFDMSIKNNMCKHIHYINNKKTKEECQYIGPLNRNSNTFIDNINNITSTTSNDNVITLDKIKQKYSSIYQKLHSLDDSSVENSLCSQIYDHLKAVEYLLNAKLLPSTNLENNSISVEPVNKNIVPQKRFFSVKKNCTRNKRIKLCVKEQTQLRDTLLGTEVINSSNNNDHDYI